MDGDRERWNAKWRERAGELEDAAPFLVEHAHLLPVAGKALDLAGGAGRNAVWLARRGLDVTLADVSDVALDKAERRATTLGVAKRMRFVRLDLEAELPFAPLFDVVMMVDYLDRARRDGFAALLTTDGMLLASHATVGNLERHASPSRRFLVEPGELAAWVRGLGMEVVVEREGWTDANRHEAAVIAKRVPPAKPETPDVEPIPSQGPYR